MFAWWLWDSADPDFFIAHADITLIQALPRDDTSLQDELTPFHGMLELFRTMPKATIAVIEGIARSGGTQRLPRLVGRARALEVVLGGQDIDATTAEAWGYVSRALPPNELRPFVDTLAARIVSFPLDVIATAKRAIDAGGQTREVETGDLTALISGLGS